MVDNAAAPATPLADLLPGGAPDWDAIDFDVLCGRCGYNLRTLTHPRCPECGLEFEWREALDRSQWSGKCLFEHECARGPLRAWGRAVWRAMRPNAYWKSVSLFAPIRLGPLCILYLSSSVTLVAMFVVGVLALTVLKNADLQRNHAGVGVAPLRIPWDVFQRPMAYQALLVLLPLLALGLLQQSLARLRIRNLQLLRVMAGIANPLTIQVTGAMFAWFAATQALCIPFVQLRGTQVWAFLFAAMVYLVALTWHIRAAVKFYLRIPHAVFVALATTMISSLSFLILVRYLR